MQIDETTKGSGKVKNEENQTDQIKNMSKNKELEHILTEKVMEKREQDEKYNYLWCRHELSLETQDLVHNLLTNPQALGVSGQTEETLDLKVSRIMNGATQAEKYNQLLQNY